MVTQHLVLGSPKFIFKSLLYNFVYFDILKTACTYMIMAVLVATRVLTF